MPGINENKLKIFQNEWLIGLLLLILVIIVRLPSIPQSFDNDSGGSAYHAQLILQGEPLYGTHHPGHHLPGVFYTYALVFGLFGNSTPALKIFLIGWVWLNALLIYGIGKKVKGKFAGVLAAVFFILVSASTFIAGDTGEIELFGNLPLTLTIWLGIELLQKRSRPAAFALVGISGAISFLYKANYLSSLGSVCLALFLLALLERRREAWMELLQRAVAILLGAAVPIGLVLAYFVGIGSLPGVQMIFTLGSEYLVRSNNVPLFYIFLMGPILVANVNMLLVLVGLYEAGYNLFSLSKTLKADRQKGILDCIILLWLLTSAVIAGISRLFFPHYSMLVVPPLAIFCALGIARFFEPRHPHQPALVRWNRYVGTALLLAIFANSLFSARDYIGGYLKYVTGEISLNEFVIQDTLFGPNRIAATQIASYIREHTTPEDTIFNWTDEAEIYYLAGRRSAANSIWPSYIARLESPDLIFASQPKYILVGSTFFERSFVLPDWLEKELKQSYKLEITLGEHQIYRRNQP